MAVKFLDHIELGGSRVKFVGDPVDPQDAANRAWVLQEITDAVTEAGGLDIEGVQDVIASVIDGTNIEAVYDDAAGTVTLSVTDSPTVGGRTPAYLMSRANHTGTQSLDTTTDSATRLALTADERTKLDGVAAGATANDTDAELRDRATHTGTQSLDTTTDSATRLALTPAERTKLGGVEEGATANADDSVLLDRANHTGTQSADTLVNGTNNKVYTAAEQTKLAGVATGATANATDAQLRDRSTHTGTQDIGTITGHTKALHDAMAIDAATVGGLDAAGIQAAVTAAIVDGAPGTLDTLNEIAAALGDNPAAITDLLAAVALRNVTYAATIGDGVATSYTITHGIGSEDVTVQVWETGGDREKVNTTIALVSGTAVRVSFGNAPAAGAYRVVIQGRPTPA